MTVRNALVAVVNESPDSLALLRSLFEQAGFRVVLLPSVTSEDLLTFVEEHRPNVVIYDVPFPYEARAEEYLRLRADPRANATRWLAITTSRRTVDRLLPHGQHVVLGKPFDPDDLMDAVGSLLDA